MRARATAVRCFSPPEISAGYLSRMAEMPNTSHSWSARASVMAGDGAADDGGQQNVLPDRQAVQQQKVLEHEAQLPVADLGQGVLV